MFPFLDLKSRPKDKPFARNQRLLREMPWLWAIKARWSDTDRVTVTQVDEVHFLDYWISNAPLDKGTCYVHTVTDYTEKLHTIMLEGHPHDMFDALTHLRKKGTMLMCVEHMVTVVGEETRVYRTKGDVTFDDLFRRHPRAQRG